MTIKKLTAAALLAVLGLAFTADRASAQVTLGPGGVQIGGQSGGSGLFVPYSGGLKNAAITNNGFAYQPSTGTTYAPAPVYGTPSGTIVGPSGTYATYPSYPAYSSYARPGYATPYTTSSSFYQPSMTTLTPAGRVYASPGVNYTPIPSTNFALPTTVVTPGVGGVRIIR